MRVGEEDRLRVGPEDMLGELEGRGWDKEGGVTAGEGDRLRIYGLREGDGDRPGVGDGERVRIGEDDRLGEEVAHRLRVREGGRVRVGENERRRWG